MRKTIGIYNLHMQARGGGEILTLVLAEHLSSNHDVLLFHSGELNPRALEQVFAVDLSRIKLISLNRAGRIWRAVAKLRGPRIPSFSLHHYSQLTKLKLDLFINASYASSLACPARQGIFLCLFPHDLRETSDVKQPMRQIRRALTTWIEKSVTGFDAHNWPESYSKVIAISRYTANWIEQLWGLPSEVIYPPCEDMGPPLEKEKIILHVGRFAAPQNEIESHHKAQEILLQTFRDMKQAQRQGWELHFAGNLGPNKAAEHFATRLTQDARGLPVKFHFNASFAELRELYRRAAIYWHATGIGYAPEDHPAKQEHFGITTVEAMSAGAVPVVKRSGGQVEIVTHGVDGIFWDDVSELLGQTNALINAPDKRRLLGEQAAISSTRFRREVLNADMDQVITRLWAHNHHYSHSQSVKAKVEIASPRYFIVYRLFSCQTPRHLPASASSTISSNGVGKLSGGS